MDDILRQAARCLAADPALISPFLSHVREILKAGPQMEVVINACFGGFSVSQEAAIRLRELGVGSIVLEGENYSDGSLNDLCPVLPDELERHDPLLVQVIKELGTKANGSCAALKILQIPANVPYSISEYDGSESVRWL